MSNPSAVDSNLLDHSHTDLEGQAAKAFGQRLRALAEDRRKTVSEIARAADIKRSAMTGYWAGDRVPPATKLFAIADFLEADARELISGERSRSTGSLILADDADWVEVSEYSLVEITDRGLGRPIVTAPIRRDWLYTTFRATKDIWLTRLLSDYTAAGLEEDQLVVCRTTTVQQLAEGNLCLWRVAGGIVVGRFSRALDAQSGGGRTQAAPAYLDPSLGIGGSDLVVPPSRAGERGPYHLVGRILGTMMRAL